MCRGCPCCRTRTIAAYHPCRRPPMGNAAMQKRPATRMGCGALVMRRFRRAVNRGYFAAGGITMAFLMTTGVVGTFSNEPTVAVRTALILSTTSVPSITLPNTA